MHEQPSATDYIRTHGLARKYGFGLGFLALAALGTALMGDPAPLVTFKTLLSIPLVIAYIGLGALFHPGRSRTPFTASFVERTLLEAVLLAIAVTGFSWAPDHAPLRTIVVAIVCVGAYFGSTIILARLRANSPR